MRNDVVVSTSEGRGLAKKGGVAVGAGASTDSLTFGDRAEMFSDLPTTFRQGGAASTAIVLRNERAERQAAASTALARPEDVVAPVHLSPKAAKQVIASGVRKLSHSFKVGDRMVQRKLGWEATPTSIVVVTVEREVKWREDKKLAPATPWAIEHRRRFKPKAGAASKRVGVVSETSDTGAEGPAPRFVEAAESIPDAFVKGAEAMAFLPVAVRGDIVSQVPSPTYFDGRLLGLCEGGSDEVTHYEVSLLRMNDDVAVVISAKKPVGGDLWEVTQAKYDLTTPEVEAAS